MVRGVNVSNKFRFLLAGMGLVLCMAVISFVMMSMFLAPHARQESSRPEGAGGEAVMFSLGEFVTNLADAGRYVRLEVELEMTGRDCLPELEAKKALVKDGVLGILRSTGYGDLEGGMGMDRLRERVREKINSVIRTGQVKEVYFSSFIAQ